MLEMQQAFQNWQAVVVGYIHVCLPIAMIIKTGGSLHLSYGLCLGSGQVEWILSYAKSRLFHGRKWNMMPWSGVSYKQITVLCSCFDTCSVLRLHFYGLSALLLWIPGWLLYCLLSYSHPSQFSDALFVCLHTPKGFLCTEVRLIRSKSKIEEDNRGDILSGPKWL